MIGLIALIAMAVTAGWIVVAVAIALAVGRALDIADAHRTRIHRIQAH